MSVVVSNARARAALAGRARILTIVAGVAVLGAATVVAAPPASAANATSTNSAYVLVPSLATATTHVAEGVFTVPTVTCRSSVSQPVAVALELLPSASPGSTDLLLGQLQISCTGRQPSYEVSAQNARGETRTGPAAPGDQLQVLMRVTTARATVNVLNLTSGVTVYATGPGFTAGTGAAALAAGYGQGVFPDFGQVQFSDVSFDQVPLGRIASRQSYDQVQGTRIIARTGPVRGGSFTIVQRSQYTPAAG